MAGQRESKLADCNKDFAVFNLGAASLQGVKILQYKYLSKNKKNRLAEEAKNNFEAKGNVPKNFSRKQNITTEWEETMKM